MSFTKSYQFEEQLFFYSLLYRALAHPARITIVKRILEMDNDWTTVRDLSFGLPITQSAVSQHIRILREMQIVECLEEVPFVSYRLNTQLPAVTKGICKLVSLACDSKIVHVNNEIQSIAGRLHYRHRWKDHLNT